MLMNHSEYLGFKGFETYLCSYNEYKFKKYP